APARGVPLPLGSPAPLGGILMSYRAISAAATGSPSRGPLAVGVVRWPAQLASRASAAAAAMRLCIYMAHAPVGFNRPGHDRVVVEAVRRRITREPFLARRLNAPLFVAGAALKHRRLAFPQPRQSKAHQCLGPLFAVERRLTPRRAAVGRDLDA